MLVLGEDDVVRDDVEVGDGGHDVRVRVGVVLRGVAAGEGRGRGEVGVRVAEVGDRVPAFVFFGGVGEAHVFFYYGDVFLRCGGLG